MILPLQIEACDDFHVFRSLNAGRLGREVQIGAKRHASCGAAALRSSGRQHTDFAAEGQRGSSRCEIGSIATEELVDRALPFWSVERHADRRPRLLARSRILAALRQHLSGEGFIEVEPAILQASPGNETHLHGFATEIIAPGGGRAVAFLHTSPEFAMKKLLAAGETCIFSFSRVFRNRERGALHAPEFAMLEWYRAGAPYERLMDDCAAFLRIAAEAARRAPPRLSRARGRPRRRPGARQRQGGFSSASRRRRPFRQRLCGRPGSRRRSFGR